MQVLVTFTKDEYDELSRKLIDQILIDSKKGWGCKFINREDGKESEDMAVRGQLIISIDKILNTIS